eukprot:scaffold318746_cov33-Tisochrysis_lutea.AAC.1
MPLRLSKYSCARSATSSPGRCTPQSALPSASRMARRSAATVADGLRHGRSRLVASAGGRPDRAKPEPISKTSATGGRRAAVPVSPSHIDGAS